jgi:hypothetical protein
MFVQLTKAFLGKPAGERIDVSEEDAKSLVAQQLAVPVTDDLIKPAVSKALESAFSPCRRAKPGEKARRTAHLRRGSTGDPKKPSGDFCQALCSQPPDGGGLALPALLPCRLAKWLLVRTIGVAPFPMSGIRYLRLV